MAGGTLKAWVQASRMPFFVATFIPLFIGWSMAVRATGAVRPGRFLIVLLGSLIVHLITNLANDYFDHLVGTDAGESIGGSRVIQEGKISPQVMLRVIIVLYVIAFFIAYIIVFHFGLHLLAIPILFSAFSSYFYVAPPIRYGYHGLGELFVGINMGPVMVAGTYWVVAGAPALEPLLVSIPVGIMVASILYYQSLPDMKTDEASGKMTLAVRLGRKGAFRGLI
ncbi:MAG TPA: prenyltransferase, partial [Syntrophorhabdaceae bacterium]|nr:prenyltransferase [Syntrophorhabdaceae bacterium]